MPGLVMIPGLVARHDIACGTEKVLAMFCRWWDVDGGASSAPKDCCCLSLDCQTRHFSSMKFMVKHHEHNHGCECHNSSYPSRR